MPIEPLKWNEQKCKSSIKRNFRSKRECTFQICMYLKYNPFLLSFSHKHFDYYFTTYNILLTFFNNMCYTFSDIRIFSSKQALCTISTGTEHVKRFLMTDINNHQSPMRLLQSICHYICILTANICLLNCSSSMVLHRGISLWNISLS